MLPFVSVVVPCRNEERYLGRCLDSILASEYPRDRMEILVVDGESDDRTREVAQRFAQADSRIRVLRNPRQIVPAALNRGVRVAKGEVIARMDAHAVYPPAYLPRLVQALLTSGADNVGGRVVTLPAGRGAVARAIALALGHPFGVGNSYFRIGASHPRPVDTVPFGCYRGEVFDRIGLFDEELIRNQDDEFNHRLIHRGGGRVLLVPDVVSYYYARASFGQLARMFYQYGCFKPLAASKVGRIPTVRSLVPAAFVAGLALPLPLALFWPVVAWPWGLALGAYAAAALACGARAAVRHGLRCGLALAAAFPVMHASYGVGYWRGLWDLAAWRRHADPAVLPLSR